MRNLNLEIRWPKDATKVGDIILVNGEQKTIAEIHNDKLVLSNNETVYHGQDRKWYLDGKAEPVEVKFCNRPEHIPAKTGTASTYIF